MLLTAPLVTALVVGTGVLTSGSSSPDSPAAVSSTEASPGVGAFGAASISAAASIRGSGAGDTEARTLGTSRSTLRVPLVDRRVPKATDRLWTTKDLELRIEPRENSRSAGLLESGKRIQVTGRRQGAYAEVITGRLTRWVTADHLAQEKAKPQATATAAAGLSGQSCPDNSSIESGLQPAAVRVYRAACAAFPELTTYGGQDGHGEHVNGQAIDFMVSSSSVGQRLADFLYANRVELDLFDIIWAQRIWTTERSSEGFRSMSDRGSATANHYDHVHIMVN